MNVFTEEAVLTKHCHRPKVLAHDRMSDEPLLKTSSNPVPDSQNEANV